MVQPDLLLATGAGSVAVRCHTPGSERQRMPGTQLRVRDFSGFWASGGCKSLVRLTQRFLGTAMGDTSPNQNRNPAFYYIGTENPLGE